MPDDTLCDGTAPEAITVSIPPECWAAPSPVCTPRRGLTANGRQVCTSGASPWIRRTEPPTPSLLHDVGWHFSPLGGVEAELKKYRENSRLELAKRLPNRDELAKAYASGRFQDGWGRLNCVPVDERFPSFVRANLALSTKRGWLRPTP